MFFGDERHSISPDVSDETRLSRPKLSFVLINGERFRMSSGEFWALMTDAYSLAYFALAGVLIAYLYPEGHRVGLNWWQVAVGVAVMEFVLLLAIVAQFFFWLRVLRGNERVVIPVTITVFVALLASESVKLVYADIFWGDDWAYPVSFSKAVVTEYVFCFILEVIFALFVISRTKIYPSTVVNSRARQRQEIKVPHDRGEAPYAPSLAVLPEASVSWSKDTETSSVTGEAAPAVIRLAGEKIHLDELQMIWAEEHYIRVVTSQQSVLLRHRMRDAVGLIPENFGVQVHRSLWLAFPMVKRFSRLPDGKLLIVLNDNSEVYVPRARRSEVEAQLTEICD